MVVARTPQPLDPAVELANGLSAENQERLTQALARAHTAYGRRILDTGEEMFAHALGMARLVADLGLDADTRIAALLFAWLEIHPRTKDKLAAQSGAEVAHLVGCLHQLGKLRPLTRAAVRGTAEFRAQAETLRKMLLAMAEDIRVVLLRLASRLQTLRWYAQNQGNAETKGCDATEASDTAAESLEIYAPLANRLGIWQIKWELEDLAFRLTEPASYKQLAKMLDERRLEREAFIQNAVRRLTEELANAGIYDVQVYGRPKHIFSIRNKMRAKNLDFAQVYDVRALRIVVREIKDCYTALGLVHALWQPIHGEFDDYISHPKGNFYRSLHTAVVCEDEKAMEVQIRTLEMHQHAELGVAAHWRYKESGQSQKAGGAYDDKIAWLRQLLSWRDEVSDTQSWLEQFRQAALDDTIYVVTPQGRVIDLPQGATPVDFAYRVHTELGHRCRGARVDGQLVPLNTPLKNGQQVDIITAKSGGPSRDWLSSGILVSTRARQKVKAWFAAQQEAELLTQGRAWVMRELQREGQTQANLEEVAKRLGLKSSDTLFLMAARNEIGPTALHTALIPPNSGKTANAETGLATSSMATRAGATTAPQRLRNGTTVEGAQRMLTQLARCCKPVPADAIAGFVTRGRGISVHRLECASFRNMQRQHPERVLPVAWEDIRGARYAADIYVEAMDRTGLLRDISDVFTKAQLSVTAANTQTRGNIARMQFAIELVDIATLTRACTEIAVLPGIIRVQRK